MLFLHPPYTRTDPSLCLTRLQGGLQSVFMVLTPEKKKELYLPYIEILKDVRTQDGVPQKDLAEAVGLSSKYVTLIESGKRIPTVECLVALMAQAGVQRDTVEGLMSEILDSFEWQE